MITGVSMGAINTYIMALHEKNDTQGTIAELSKWLKIEYNYRCLLDVVFKNLSSKIMAWWFNLWNVLLKGHLRREYSKQIFRKVVRRAPHSPTFFNRSDRFADW